jgi:Leucine-rich repeat (LRR) protein
LSRLPTLPALTQLSLRGTQVRGAGLAALERLPALQTLFLDETPLDETAVSNLPPLPQLRTLSLRKTSLSAAALPGLIQKLPGLQVLELPRTESLTREVLDELVDQTGWRVFH